MDPTDTQFAAHQVINAAAVACEQHVAQKKRVYTILLIITDGEQHSITPTSISNVSALQIKTVYQLMKKRRKNN